MICCVSFKTFLRKEATLMGGHYESVENPDFINVNRHDLFIREVAHKNDNITHIDECSIYFPSTIRFLLSRDKRRIDSGLLKEETGERVAVDRTGTASVLATGLVKASVIERGSVTETESVAGTG